MIEKLSPNHAIDQDKLLEEKLKTFDAKLKAEDLKRQAEVQASPVQTDKKIVIVHTPKTTKTDLDWAKDKAA